MRSRSMSQLTNIRKVQCLLRKFLEQDQLDNQRLKRLVDLVIQGLLQLQLNNRRNSISITLKDQYWMNFQVVMKIATLLLVLDIIKQVKNLQHLSQRNVLSSTNILDQQLKDFKKNLQYQVTLDQEHMSSQKIFQNLNENQLLSFQKNRDSKKRSFQSSFQGLEHIKLSLKIDHLQQKKGTRNIIRLEELLNDSFRINFKRHPDQDNMHNR